MILNSKYIYSVLEAQCFQNSASNYVAQTLLQEAHLFLKKCGRVIYFKLDHPNACRWADRNSREDTFGAHIQGYII